MLILVNNYKGALIMVLLSVLSFVSSIFYLYVGVRTFLANRKSKLCRIFILMTFSLVIWAFGFGFIYVAEDIYQYSFWNKVAAFGWCTFEALVLCYVMLITENKLIKNWYIKSVIIFPAPFFLFMVLFLFGPGIQTAPIIEKVFYTGNFIYNFSYLAISIILLSLWGQNSKSDIIKKQAKIIVICSIIPFFLNLIVQTILPMFGLFRIPNMGQIFAMIMFLGVNYTIIRYQFMSIPTSLITNKLFNELTGMMILTDTKGIIIKVNKQVYSLLEYKEYEIIGNPITKILSGSAIGEIMETSETIHELIRLQDQNVPTKLGTELPFHISIIPLHTKSSLLQGLLFIGEDLRATKQLEEELERHKVTNTKLRNSEALFRTLLEVTPISIVLVSKTTGIITYLNTRALELFGAQKSELIGLDITELLQNPEDKHILYNNIELIENESRKEILLLKRDGTKFTGLVTMVLAVYHDEEVIFSCIIDMTEQKNVEETLKRNNENISKLNHELILMNDILMDKSNKDSLTNIYNHQYMNEILDLKLIEREKTSLPLCLMMLDIDHFKRVNDVFGHQVGDKVLVNVVELITLYTRSSDYIGRYGGEEFIVVMPGIFLETAAAIAERIRENIQEFDFGVVGLKVTISIGVVQCKDESSNALVNKADMLLYEAKKNGRNRVEV